MSQIKWESLITIESNLKGLCFVLGNWKHSIQLTRYFTVKVGCFLQRCWCTCEEENTRTRYIHKFMHIMLQTVSTLTFSSKKMEKKALLFYPFSENKTKQKLVTFTSDWNDFYDLFPSSQVQVWGLFLWLSTLGFGYMSMYTLARKECVDLTKIKSSQQKTVLKLPLKHGMK